VTFCKNFSTACIFLFLLFLLLRQKKSNFQPDELLGSTSTTIELPPEFVLDPPNQPARKYFNPILVVKYTPSLPANEVAWMVKSLDQKKKKTAEIKVKLNGIMRL